MLYRILAETVLVVHLAYVLFAVLGGLLALRWRWVVWLHLPAAAWAVLIMAFGWVCPLTPLENHLRLRAGQAGYEGGFLEHYIVSVLYPAGLTRTIQWLLGAGALAANVLVYAVVLRQWRRQSTETPAD